MGKIILILGAMFCSKTTHLLTYARQYRLAGKKVVLVKYVNDTRYSSDDICTHDKVSLEATFACKSFSEIGASPEIKEADVILIDEAQFITDLVEYVDNLANSGKLVILSMLSGNFLREEFENVSKLIPKCEEIVHLHTICKCGENAYFTKRKSDSLEIEIIGNDYVPVCRKCYFGTPETPNNITPGIEINKQLIISSSKKEPLSTLLKQKCNVNFQDSSGITALMWAAYNNDLTNCLELLSAKANPNLKDNNGCTAMSLALTSNATEIVKKLLEAGAEQGELIFSEWKV